MRRMILCVSAKGRVGSLDSSPRSTVHEEIDCAREVTVGCREGAGGVLGCEAHAAGKHIKILRGTPPPSLLALLVGGQRGGGRGLAVGGGRCGCDRCKLDVAPLASSSTHVTRRQK